MPPSVDVSDERFKTYPVRTGWVTVVGDFDDTDVLRALYLAHAIRDKQREIRSLVEMIRSWHVAASNSANGTAADLDWVGAASREQHAALERRHADLLNELRHLERLFAACGYERIRFEGRLGSYLLPFEGHGLTTALEILSTVLDAQIATSDRGAVDGTTEADTLRQLARRLQMRRHAISDGY